MALHRFKPGVSGNPAGRPPKVTTFLRHAEVALLKDLEKRALEGGDKGAAANCLTGLRMMRGGGGWPMRSPIENARAELHGSKAALITAWQRLADAEHRFEEAHDCSASFIASGTANSSLAWWDAQVRLAERSVVEAELRLARTVSHRIRMNPQIIIRDDDRRAIGSIMHSLTGILARDRFGNRIGVFTRTREAVAAVFKAANYRPGRKLGCCVSKKAVVPVKDRQRKAPMRRISSAPTSRPASSRFSTKSKPFSFGERAQPGAPRTGFCRWAGAPPGNEPSSRRLRRIDRHAEMRDASAGFQNCAWNDVAPIGDRRGAEDDDKIAHSLDLRQCANERADLMARARLDSDSAAGDGEARLERAQRFFDGRRLEAGKQRRDDADPQRPERACRRQRRGHRVDQCLFENGALE